MSSRASSYDATVLAKHRLSDHLLRLSLGGPGLAGFESTQIPDEWVGLVVPGQFQSRYYTVRNWDGETLTLDIVVHNEGLVTGWATGDCVGDRVTVTAAKGSFAPPADAQSLMLVGDLTALPAMARIAEAHPTLPTRIWAEVPDDLATYFPEHASVTWLPTPPDGGSELAELVEALVWPEGPGYFWMAGESAQMRAIRKHLMRTRRLPSTSFDVMGYWRGVEQRQPRAVDPAPVWRAGKAAGLTDDEIWLAYDAQAEVADSSAHDHPQEQR